MVPLTLPSHLSGSLLPLVADFCSVPVGPTLRLWKEQINIKLKLIQLPSTEQTGTFILLLIELACGMLLGIQDTEGTEMCDNMTSSMRCHMFASTPRSVIRASASHDMCIDLS